MVHKLSSHLFLRRFLLRVGQFCCHEAMAKFEVTEVGMRKVTFDRINLHESTVWRHIELDHVQSIADHILEGNYGTTIAEAPVIIASPSGEPFLAKVSHTHAHTQRHNHSPNLFSCACRSHRRMDKFKCYCHARTHRHSRATH